MSKKASPGIRWATHFFLLRSGRGYVTAGIRNTDIYIIVSMDPAQKKLSETTENYERSCQPDSIWQKEMNRISNEAESKVRKLWKKYQATH